MSGEEHDRGMIAESIGENSGGFGFGSRTFVIEFAFPIHDYLVDGHEECTGTQKKVGEEWIIKKQTDSGSEKDEECGNECEGEFVEDPF